MKMKKVLSIALALVLAIGMLAGCNGGKQSEAAKNFTDSDEMITMTWLSYPVLAGCEEGTDPELLIEEKFNVDIKPLFYEQTNFNDKKTMLMAGGEIPDLVYELDPVNVYNDVDQDFIVELPYETVEKYAPNYYAYLTENYPAAWSYARYDDANWGLPNLNYDNESAKAHLYRKDWLDKLGLEVPVTLDDMHDVLYAFVHNDPDGNGKDDTFGYSPTGTHYQYFFTEQFGAYGILPFDWQEVDGEIVYGGLREECEEVLAMLAQWYKEGLIHPDFVAAPNINNMITAGQIGYLDWSGRGHANPNEPTSLLSVLREGNPNADLIHARNPIGPDGLYGTRNWGALCHVVSFGKTEQYGTAVPRMLKIFDAMFADEDFGMEVRYGKEGVAYNVKEENRSSEWGAILEYTPDYDTYDKRRLKGYLNTLTGPSFFAPLAMAKGAEDVFKTDAVLAWNEKYDDPKGVLTDAFYKVDIIASATDYLEDLVNKQMKLMADIIQGKKPADSYIEEFTTLWNNGGGDIMLEEARAYNDILEAMYKDLGVK